MPEPQYPNAVVGPTFPSLPWLSGSGNDGPADDPFYSAPQWPTQLYDINGNPTTMLPAGAPIPSGSYTSLGDAYAARYQASQNPMLNSGAGGMVQQPFTGPILNSGSAPGVIGGQLDTPSVPSTPVGPTVGIPTPGNPTGAGSSGGGLFGTGVDIGIPGLISAGNIMGGVAAGVGIGSALGGGSSGVPEQKPTTVVPPIIPTINLGGSPTVPSTGTTPIPVTGQGTNTNPSTGTPHTDRPAVTTIPPIVPPLGGGGTTPVGPPSTVTPPVTPTTPTTPTVPTSNILDRDYLREGTSTNAANSQLGQGIFGNYANFSGQYGAQDQANFAALLNQLGISNSQLSGIANAQTGAANTALRTGNASDASALGPQQLSLLQSLNPNQYAALNATQAGATGGIASNQFQNGLGGQFAAGGGNPLLAFANSQAQGAGYSPLGQDLQSMARDQLSLGGQATPWELNQAEQAAREAWSARGLVNSQGAVGAEIINRDDLQRQRLMDRQQFAQNVNQLGMGQQSINNSFTLGTQGANQSATNQNQNLGLNLANLDYGRQQQGFQNLFNNAQLQSSAAFNPFAGMNQNTTNTGSNSTLFGQNAGFSSGALGNQAVQQQVNPFNPYAADIFGGAFNAANARAIAAGNNAAAMAGAQDQASGSIANSFLGLLGQYFRPTAQGGFGGGNGVITPTLDTLHY